MLQSLLQPRDNQRVAVRHERRRAEKRSAGRRPSQLPLQLGRAIDVDATPSPEQHRLRNELYVCGKVAALHAVVGSLLLGIVVLVVGLVQLSPGAEAAQHRYYLMGTGAALVGAGVLGAVLRCICLHWYNRKFREEEEEIAEAAAHKNGVSVVESGHGHDKHARRDHAPDKHALDKHPLDKHPLDKHALDKHALDKHAHDKLAHDKPKLKTQISVGKDFDHIKQPSAANET